MRSGRLSAAEIGDAKTDILYANEGQTVKTLHIWRILVMPEHSILMPKKFFQKNFRFF